MNFAPGESSAVVEHTQAMDYAVKSFMETKFASNICLGELDIEGLHQLCRDPDASGDHPEDSSSEAGTSSNPSETISFLALRSHFA
ncbi:unnamed protein product [Lactuca virosa]|uniref:Uncharacterized protein n=1 Tax=Lactuca virosa TaxID=75947 RepID=A0AAU9MQH9_9ASTR|nr:unnamed protein product [Lactuca virosa]